MNKPEAIVTVHTKVGRLTLHEVHYESPAVAVSDTMLATVKVNADKMTVDDLEFWTQRLVDYGVELGYNVAVIWK